MKYEYCVVQIAQVMELASNVEIPENNFLATLGYGLNEMGERGWRLVSVIEKINAMVFVKSITDEKA